MLHAAVGGLSGTVMVHSNDLEYLLDIYHQHRAPSIMNGTAPDNTASSVGSLRISAHSGRHASTLRPR